MPDTTVHYYNSAGQEVPYDSLSPELKQQMSQYFPQTNQQSDTHHIARAFFVGFFGMLVLFLILLRRFAGQTEVTSEADTDNSNAAEKDMPPIPAEYYVYNGAKLGLTREQITAILAKRYPYYNHLTATLKYRFVNRLVEFIRCKNFIIYSKEPLKEMPVLASATAIQLTFGLDDYLLPWFVYIRIHPEEYFAQDSLRVLAGNVEGNTITLAWNQLLLGINDETDGVNIGLHEMAHALYYQHAEVQGERTGKFAGHFDEVMEEGEEVYKFKTTQHLLFTDYAYRNLQEFWAESVEIFFEKPGEMQRCYPHIYDTLKELLQQNPMNRENPLE